MRLHRALITLLLLTFTSLSAIAQYQQPQYQWGRPKPPKTGACFYKDSNFRGDYFCLKLGDNWSSMPSGFNDKITAIRLFSGAQVRVFNDNNFKGVNTRITRDVMTCAIQASGQSFEELERSHLFHGCLSRER